MVQAASRVILLQWLEHRTLNRVERVQAASRVVIVQWLEHRTLKRVD